MFKEKSFGCPNPFLHHSSPFDNLPHKFVRQLPSTLFYILIYLHGEWQLFTFLCEDRKCWVWWRGHVVLFKPNLKGWRVMLFYLNSTWRGEGVMLFYLNPTWRGERVMLFYLTRLEGVKGHVVLFKLNLKGWRVMLFHLNFPYQLFT